MGMLRIERIGVGLAVLAAVTSFSNLQVAPHPEHVLAVWSVGPAVIAASTALRLSGRVIRIRSTCPCRSVVTRVPVMPSVTIVTVGGERARPFVLW